MRLKKKKQTIMDIVRELQKNPKHIEYRVVWEKWKFNHLPKWYRDQHIKDILEKIAMIREGKL